MRFGGRGSLLRLMVASRRQRQQTRGTALLEAAQPFPDRGHGGSKQPRGGLDAALLGAFDQPQTMVVGVFHLTHQIEITGGSSHDAEIVSAARRPVPRPGGNLVPPLLAQTLEPR